MIEFNARFGDPETQVVLPLLVTPLSGLLFAAATGGLGDLARPEFSDDVAVTVVLASEGYPDEPITGRPITGLDAGARRVHRARGDREGRRRLRGHGRPRAQCGRDRSPTSPRPGSKAYAALEVIQLEGGQYRTDIAKRVE